MENKSSLNTEVDEYEYLDPKVAPRSSVGGEGGAAGDIPRTKNAFNEAIVFMVGGGNYIEYQNLVDLFNNVSEAKYVCRYLAVIMCEKFEAHQTILVF